MPVFSQLDQRIAARLIDDEAGDFSFSLFRTFSRCPLGPLGLPGFRSKLWLLDETTGDFGGIYEWDTVEDAANYEVSYAMRFSKWRSVPGSFSTDVFPRSDHRSGAHQMLREGAVYA